MSRLVISLISTLLFVGLISGGDFSAAAQPTKQETHGPSSPAAYTSKGNITITINELEEIRKTIQELIESSKNDRDIEISKLKKRLSEIHQTQLRVLPQEADEWAEQFFSTLPLRKDKVVTQENEERMRFEKQQMDIPVLFGYTISKFDEYILALKKHDPKISFIIEQIPDVITHGDSSIMCKSPSRIVIFPNGTSFEMNLSLGNIKNTQFASYPSLTIYEVNDGLRHIVFSMVHSFNIGSGLMYGNGEMSESFKKELTRLYDLIIENAYLRSSK